MTPENEVQFQVNCGYATTTGGGMNLYYVVCQYFPGGNWGREYVENVGQLGDGSGAGRVSVGAVLLAALFVVLQ